MLFTITLLTALDLLASQFKQCRKYITIYLRPVVIIYIYKLDTRENTHKCILLPLLICSTKNLILTPICDFKTEISGKTLPQNINVLLKAEKLELLLDGRVDFGKS